MEKFFVLFPVFLILLSVQASAAVVINEVMYNPQCSDYYCEYVELHNPSKKAVDLGQWKLCGDLLKEGYVNKSDGLYSKNGTTLSSNSYALITDGESGTLAYSNFNVSPSLALHVDSSSLCGGLNNDGENITLWNGSLVDSFDYSNYSVEEGKSLQLLDEGWNESFPTPGESNGPETNDTSENTTDTTDQSTDENTSSEVSSGSGKNLIRITDCPQSAKFGGVVNVKIKVSKNETDKYAVYGRIERKSDGWDVSEESKAYLKDKNQNYTLTIPVLVKPNCDWRYENGTYRLLVEGLGTEDTEEIEISGTEEGVCEVVTEVKVKEKTKEVVKENCSCNSTSSTRKEEYEIFSYDDEVKVGENLETTVLIRNKDNESKELEVYSYVYKGNEPVNEGGWTGNARKIEVDPLEKDVLLMRNEIKESVNSGTYDLKVRIKNEEDLVRKVKVVAANETSQTKNVTEGGNQTSKPSDNQTSTDVSEGNTSTESKITGKVFRKEGPLEKFVGLFEGVFALF